MPLVNAKKNKINHIVLLLDASGSMGKWKREVISVSDNLVNFLATKSQENEQETRITVYSFSGWREQECLIYDMDVLRLPSISTLYQCTNMTALLDATHLAIDDMMMIPQKYGDHSVVLYVLTDGEENNSKNNIPELLRGKINGLPDNWSVAVFVPDASSVKLATHYGFPQGNIKEWDASSSKGFEEAGKILRDTSDAFMTGRTQGIRGSKSLFTLNKISGADILRNLTPLVKYNLLPVTVDSRIDVFVGYHMGRPIRLGEGYYELMKKEKIQPQKKIAIQYKGSIFAGDARTLLGLPDQTVEVSPDSHPEYKIFVQSTAPNRKLIAGTNLLVLQ